MSEKKKAHLVFFGRTHKKHPWYTIHVENYSTDRKPLGPVPVIGYENTEDGLRAQHAKFVLPELGIDIQVKNYVAHFSDDKTSWVVGVDKTRGCDLLQADFSAIIEPCRAEDPYSLQLEILAPAFDELIVKCKEWRYGGW